MPNFCNIYAHGDRVNNCNSTNLVIKHYVIDGTHAHENVKLNFSQIMTPPVCWR